MSNLFNIGSSGLRNGQAQLATIGNNLSNSQTEGYSRQRVETTEAPQSGGAVRVGSGVFTGNATRDYSDLLNNQRNTSYSGQADYQAQKEGLDKLDSLYTYSNEHDASLSARINDFFSAGAKLAQDPTSTAARQTTLSSGQTLSNLFNSLSHELQTYEATADSTIDRGITGVNDYSQRISGLNEEIAKVRAQTNSEPNELLDERDKMVAGLSNLVGIEVVAQDGSQLNISLSNGKTLVAGSEHFALDKDRLGELKGGQLGGTLAFRNGDLAQARTNLNNMATAVATQVNNVQENGYDLDGQKGSPLFEIDANAPDAAAGIKVALDDPRKIAAAETANSGPKDNRNALKMVELQHQRFDFGTTKMTFNEAYASNISQIGTRTNDMKNRVTAQEKITQQLEGKQQSLSGVNRDEEFANLSAYQRYYQSNAKVLSTAETLIDTILKLS